MNIEIKDGYIIIPEQDTFAVHKQNLYIQDGFINYSKPFKQADKIIDVQQKVILPGLVNAHHHIYSCLSKGIPAETPFENFTGTLEKLWWRLDRSLQKEDIILSTVLTLQDCIKHGVTTVFDHHISVDYITNCLSTMANIFNDFHISGALCFEISDRNGEEIFQKSLQENISFIDQHTFNHIHGMIGLHASFTLSDDSLKIIAQNTNNYPIHIHVAEGEIDELKCQENYGKSIIHRLDDFDLLRENSLLIHCSNLSLEEIEQLQNRNIFIVQAIDSNMNNALNVGNISTFLRSDIPTTVGTDGMTSNILKTYKNSFLFTKYQNKNPDLGFLEMNQLIMNSYRLKQAFGIPLGIHENENADIVILDYKPATPFNSDTFLSHFIYGITESRPQWVIKNDHILMDDYHVHIPDSYNEIIETARETSKNLFQRF